MGAKLYCYNVVQQGKIAFQIVNCDECLPHLCLSSRLLSFTNNFWKDGGLFSTCLVGWQLMFLALSVFFLAMLKLSKITAIYLVRNNISLLSISVWNNGSNYENKTWDVINWSYLLSLLRQILGSDKIQFPSKSKSTGGKQDGNGADLNT